MFDDLKELMDTVGFFNINAILELFLRLICVTVHTNVEVAANIFLHCLEVLPSRHRGYSTDFSPKEKKTLFLLISNKIWTPLSGFKLMYDIEVEHRAEALQKSLVYHIDGESVIQRAPVSEDGIKDVKKAIERIVDSEGDQTFRQVLDEIKATNTMSLEMYRRLEEIVNKYTTMERNGDRQDLPDILGFARGVDSIFADKCRPMVGEGPFVSLLILFISIYLSRLGTIETGQNRTEPPVNRRLGLEALPNHVKKHTNFYKQDLHSTSGIACAVASIANHVKKHTNFYPRNNQIIALITLLLEESRVNHRNENVKGGWFLEVATGEGKSTIVAMFAAIQALHGKYVDVVTSSDVLARRDEEEWKEFYADLGLSSCVVPNPEVLKCEIQKDADNLLRKKYQSNIVYGTVSEFAADVLRHEFEKRNIRGRRPFQIVIVDEVDSMTLDNGMQLTYLSHDTTSLRHTEQLLAMIWCLLSSSLPIQDSQTGDILWASKPKYIHAAIAEYMVEDNEKLVDKSYDILQDGCSSPLYLFKREDCDRIRQLASNGGTEEAEERLKMTQTLMESITPDDEVELITSQNIPDVSFQFYKLDANIKATPCSHENIKNVSDGEGSHVMLLLLEKGIVRELFTEQGLKTVAIDSIDEKIMYSDGSRGIRSINGNTKIECKVDTNVPNEEEARYIVLPMYLKEYVDQCLPVFIDNALKAVSMTLGREYYIVDGRDTPSKDQDQDHSFDRVVPVDFEGTGMLEKNKKWSDGLQQFLEMKHQLAISPISTVTNFLSNYRFFQRYSRSGGIHGVTGTLGDSTDHEFLQKHFSVKCVSIPPHRTKKLVYHPMLQIRDKGKESWIAAVCRRTEEIAKKQTVLVVCEDLKTAESFESKLQSSTNVKVHMYTRSDIHKYEIEEHEFNREEVIITTTLGGRGTDYKVHRYVNSNGGLFVILTFFPENLRVEKQMIGRTARKGDPGMVQFILHEKSLPEAYQGQGLKSMHSLRLRTVEEKIRNLENTELINVNRREFLFEAFCWKLKSFDHHYTDQEKDPHNLKQTACLTGPKFDYGSGLSSVKEQWAFWLALNRPRIEDSGNNLRSLQKDMELVIQSKIDETQRGVSNNCYDHARNAMNRMTLLGKDVNRVAEKDFGTFGLWQRLIDTEKVYKAVALYNQAYVTIKTRKDGNSYREKALNLLDKTLEAIEAYTTEMANVTYSVQIASSSGNTKSHLADKEGQTNFSKQQTARGSFIKAWRDSINSAIEMLKSEKTPDDFEFYVEPVGLNFAVDVFNDVMEAEMMLLADMGVTYFFKVEKEKKFKFCWNALWCFLLGALQVVAGVLLVGLTCGAASTFGLGLISEGISDMIDGFIGMVTGTFSWVQYAISKAISLAISLVSSGISALKRAAKTAWKGIKTTVNGLKGVATAATKEVAKTTTKEVAKTVTKEATKKAMEANFKLASKYILKEVGKRAVLKGAGFVWNKALTALLEKIFKNIFRDTIQENLKKSPTLCSSLEKVIKQTLTTLESPSESDKEQLIKTVQRTSENAVSKTLNSFEKFDKLWNEMERFKGLASSIASKVDSEWGTAVNVASDIVYYTRMVTEAIKTWPTGSYMKDTVASELSKEINSVFKLDSSNRSLESQTEEDVYKHMYDSICEIVTDVFTDKIVNCLVSISERHASQYVSSRLSSAAANVLNEANVNQRIADQDHYWAMKVDSEDTTQSKELSRKEVEQVNQLADEAEDPSKEASHLHLHVLAQSGLTEGRDIIVDIVDENGKSITSAQYNGGSDNEPIKVQLVQTKDR